MKLATATERDRWLAFVAQQKLPLEVMCEPWRPERTSRQNRYLWKAVYGPLVERCGFTAEDWHEYFCELVFGTVEVVKPSGEIVTKPKRTTTTNEFGKRDVLKGEPFNAFVRKAEKFCAERGVFIAEEWVDG